MNCGTRLFSAIKAIGLVLILGIHVSAIAQTWKEEVLLHDGTVIIAERVYSSSKLLVFGAGDPNALVETVTFFLPHGGTINWKTDFNDAVPDPNGLNHIRFDVVDGVPYLATFPAGCIGYNKWGRPNPPQVLFKYADRQWQRITLAELPPVLVNKRANVVVGMPPAGAKSFYTVRDVNTENARVSLPAYKTILSEPVSDPEFRCGEMVYDGNGGWLGIGFFKKQPSLQACVRFCEQKRMPAQYCPCNSIFEGK